MKLVQKYIKKINKKVTQQIKKKTEQNKTKQKKYNFALNTKLTQPRLAFEDLGGAHLSVVLFKMDANDVWGTYP